MTNEQEAFANLESKLNTAFESETKDISTTIAEIKQEIAVVEEKKNSLVNIRESPMIMQDQEYIRAELKTLLVDSRIILQKLSSNIKVGSSSKDYEAYAKMISSISNVVKELRELNRNVVDLKVQSGKLDNNILNKKISLTADQLLQMIEKAKMGNQLQAIDAKFTVTEEEK